MPWSHKACVKSRKSYGISVILFMFIDGYGRVVVTLFMF